MRASAMFRRRSCARLAVICLALGIGSLGASAAETHAVVVGINDYVNVMHVRGAVADANDISAALKQAGVTDLVTLIDSEATRKNVLGAIDRLIAHAKTDDLAVVTFSGLAARESWGTVRPPGTKDGGSYEIFLLRDVVLPGADGGIDPKLPGSAAERILDAELDVRFKRLDDMGVRTIFVADVGAGSRPFRLADGTDPLEPVIGLLPAPIDIDKETRSLSFLAAVDKHHRLPEVEIPKDSGNRRGALSYAFARVIEGAALHDGKTDLSHGDLVDFVLTSIKNSMLDNILGQQPDLRPRRDFDRVVIKFGTDLRLGTPPAPSSAGARQ